MFAGSIVIAPLLHTLPYGDDVKYILAAIVRHPNLTVSIEGVCR